MDKLHACIALQGDIFSSYVPKHKYSFYHIQQNDKASVPRISKWAYTGDVQIKTPAC